MQQKVGVVAGLAIGALGLSLATAVEAQADTTVYRLYNPGNGEHLYTTDRNERDALFATGGWGYEGEAWFAPDEGTPVYRLYNERLQNHLYTSDINEINVLTTVHGWTQDNDGQPLFYSGGGVGIYRVYNKELRGLHHWTTDGNEYSILPSYGWAQEGVAFKATGLGLPIQTQFAKQGQAIASATSTTQTNTVSSTGSYTFTKDTDVRNEPKAAAPVQFTFAVGDSVRYDQKVTADGHTWISYMGNSGTRRYAMVD